MSDLITIVYVFPFHITMIMAGLFAKIISKKTSTIHVRICIDIYYYIYHTRVPLLILLTNLTISAAACGAGYFGISATYRTVYLLLFVWNGIFSYVGIHSIILSHM